MIIFSEAFRRTSAKEIFQKRSFQKKMEEKP
jgi:hypothetical protein